MMNKTFTVRKSFDLTILLHECATHTNHLINVGFEIDGMLKLYIGTLKTHRSAEKLIHSSENFSSSAISEVSASGAVKEAAIQSSVT